MSSPLRKPLVIAAVLAAAAIGVVLAKPADASHTSTPGTGGKLTSANAGAIQISGSAALQPSICDGVSCDDLYASDLSWSPDGSRAVFLDQVGEIMTVRYNNGKDSWFVMDPAEGHTYSHPTFRSTGGTIVWADSDGGPWRLMLGSTDCCNHMVQLSPKVTTTSYSHPDGGPNGRVVFEKQANGGSPEVWLWDGSYIAENDDIDAHSTKVVNGTDPAISPDGTKVAYIGSDGHLWTADINGANAADIASGTFSNPAWSPDGNTIAFNSGTNVFTVPTAGGTPKNESMTGAPAYRSEQRNAVIRLAGNSRFETATAVSQSHWKTAGDASDTTRVQAHAVVLSRSDDFADALGGAALAAAKEGPLLLTPPASFNAATKAEISRILGSDTSSTVYILGGLGAISQTVEDQIRAMGYQVDRLAGSNRFDTGLKIADAITTNPTIILAATGVNFPDALAAGAAAGSYDTPGATDMAVVVLTDDSKLPAVTKTYLDAHVNLNVSLFGIGGQAAKATAGYDNSNTGYYESIIGSNRYDTAERTADRFFGGHHYAGIATGTDWPDALAGGALLGTLNGPLLLTPGKDSSLDQMTAWHLSVNSMSISTGLVFGGSAVVSSPQATQLGTVISGPAGSSQSTNAVSGFSLAVGRSLIKITEVPAELPARTTEEFKATADNQHR